MPLQNRVTPLGELVADPARGLVYGNRGCLHREGAPFLVLGAQLLRWTASGYAARTPRPAGRRELLITSPSLVEVLRAGWQPLVPLLHPSALDG